MEAPKAICPNDVSGRNDELWGNLEWEEVVELRLFFLALCLGSFSLSFTFQWRVLLVVDQLSATSESLSLSLDRRRQSVAGGCSPLRFSFTAVSARSIVGWVDFWMGAPVASLPLSPSLPP